MNQLGKVRRLYYRDGLIAVGMGITAHPPHRSVRAALPHTAPASGFDVKSFIRERV